METINEVPGWLPVLATILSGVAVAWRKGWPIVEEMWDAAKRTKIDNYIGDGVAALNETTVKDIRAKIADGVLTKEEGHRILINLGKNFAQEVVDVFGKLYLGDNTKQQVERKIERAVGSLKAADGLKNLGKF